MIEVSGQISEAEWNAYVDGHADGTVDHLWRWRTVFSEVFGHDSVYLAARDNGAVVGVLPLVRFRSRLFGRSIVSVPFLNYGGVLSSNQEATQALVDAARTTGREFKAAHVELRHHRRQVEALPFRAHKLQLTRPLPATSEQLWTTIDRKVRNQVRKAQKDGLTAVVGGAELVDQFYEVFARNMRDLGTPVYAKALFASTLRLFSDAARVIVVRSGEIPVAASIAIKYRDTVLVPWASSLREYRQQCPNMLLYWTMLEQAIKDGATTFDFGRSSPGSGPHHFKLQWGAGETPMFWEYVMLAGSAPPDQGKENPKFNAVIEAWKRLPMPVANAIGPHIVRNIP